MCGWSECKSRGFALLAGALLLVASCGGENVSGPTGSVGPRVGAPAPAGSGSHPAPLDCIRGAEQPVPEPGDALATTAGAPRPQVLRACQGGSVQVPRSEVLVTKTREAFTLGLWVRLGTVKDQLLLQGDDVSLGVHEGRFRASIAGEHIVGLNAVPSEWYQLTLVKQGQEARFFVNGLPFGSRQIDHGSLGRLVLGSTDPSCVLFEALRLGWRAEHDGPFTPLQQLGPLDDVLLGFSFDETLSGSSIRDESGQGNDGSIWGDVALIDGAI